MLNQPKTIEYFSAVESLKVQQDTVRNQILLPVQTNLDSTSNLIIDSKPEDSIPVKTFQQIDFSAIDSIMRLSEERERQIQEQAERQAAILRWRQRKIDTTEILYKEFGIAHFPIQEGFKNNDSKQNFLFNIPSVKPEEKQVKQTVFIEEGANDRNTKQEYKTEIVKEDAIKPKLIQNRVHFDWITILLIASFLLLGWIRLFNKKYLSSLVKAIVSYKESNALYRERNSLMERASFMVNLLYLSNISVFVVQLRHFWKIDFSEIQDLFLYAIVFVSLIGLYVLRAISSSFIGYVFLKQKVYSEYFHNVNIFTKNTGIFLYPVIITLQFLPYQYLDFVVYVGIAICLILYLFQVLRSFQIFIRKNVSIYYMILYLCAFEIAPFLIIYKVLLSLA